MNPEENNLKFTLLFKEMEFLVRTRRHEYFSLMSLISDRLSLPDFGICSGMGSCGTCIVEISPKNTDLKRSFLSCEVQVDEALENVAITIYPDR
jgi:hypothetical protein